MKSGGAAHGTSTALRVYLPGTIPLLRAALASGEFAVAGATGFAVTSGLRSDYPDADTEDLEYLAMHDAAVASLRLIAAGEAEPVRVVVAVDCDATERTDLDRAAVRVTEPVAWRQIVSVHLDGGETAEVIEAASAAVDAADLGDLDAGVVVGEAEDIDLAWYAPSEIGYLLTELSAE